MKKILRKPIFFIIATAVLICGNMSFAEKDDFQRISHKLQAGGDMASGRRRDNGK